MAYQSKYTGLQIDDILDSVEWKQDQIEDLASIRAGAAKGATALQSYTEKYTGTVTGIKINGTVKSGSGVIDLGTITTVTESTVSGWGFTKNAGTYSKPSGGIPKSDLASAVQTSLGKADTALQSYTEQYKGTITGVSANGTSVATSGVANIPAASTSAYGVTKLSSATNSTSTSLAATASAVKAAYDLANGKQDKLVSGTNIKTINGTSILGSGDITISGGGSDANKIFMLYMDSVPGVGETGVFSSISAYDFVDAIDNHYLFYVSTGVGRIFPCAVSTSSASIVGDGVIVYLGITKDFSNNIVEWECISETYLQAELVSGTNIKTINGTSLLGSGDIVISGGGGDYLPLTGGTITGDLTLTDGPGGAGNFQSYTVSSKEFFSDIYYLERNGEHAVIMGNNKVEIINGIEQTKASIDWSGDGTKFLSNDGTYKTISGGGSSSSGITSVKINGQSKTPSSGVVDLGYINKQLSTSTSSSMTLSPNIYYRNTSTSLSTLTIKLGNVSNSNIINEYFVEFTTRSSGTTVSLPSTIKWANGETPTFEASTTYQISIVNNLGTIQKFK